MTRILVTGANGYLGSALTSELLLAGHEVLAVDWLLHGRTPLAVYLGAPGFRLVPADSRTLDPALLSGIEAVIDLAAVTGPSACRDNRELAHAVNVAARKRLMLLAKALGVERYVLVAGLPGDGPESRLERAAEQELMRLHEPGFIASVLRFGELFGLSRRTRFDLTFNGLVAEATASGQFSAPGGAAPLRLMHVRDAALSLVHLVSAPPRRVGGRIFSTASAEASAQDIIGLIAATLPGWVPNYPKGNFMQIAPAFGLTATISPAQGVMELHIALRSGRASARPCNFNDAIYRKFARTGLRGGDEPDGQPAARASRRPSHSTSARPKAAIGKTA